MTTSKDSRTPVVLWIAFGLLFGLALVSGFLVLGQKESIDSAATIAALAREQATNAQEELDVAKSELGALVERRDSIKTDLVPLQSQLLSVRDDVADLQEQRGRIREDMATAEARRLAADSELTEIQTRVASEQRKLDAFIREVETARSDASEARKAASNSDQTLRSVNASIETTSERLAALKKSLADHELEKISLSRAVATLLRDQASMQAEVDKATEAIAQADRLRDHVRTLQGQVSVLNDQIRDRKSVVLESNEELATTESDLGLALEQLAMVRARSEVASKEQSAAETRLAELVESIRLETRREQQLTKDVHELESRKRELDSVIERIQQGRAELSLLEQRQSSLEISTKSLQSSRERLGEEVAQQHSQLTDNLLKRDLTRLSSSLQTLVNRISELVEQATPPAPSGDDEGSETGDQP